MKRRKQFYGSFLLSVCINMHGMDKHKNTQHDFKGFDDHVEVFRSGEHTSSNGVKRTWTNEELDQMVANHSAATAAPIVVGHPTHNDPAYGWIDELKRDGDSLQAKFRDVNPAFATGVEDGAYRKRSVRIYKTPDNTMAIEHVGFLGARRPAIPLDAMNYSSADAEETYDFEADWYTPNVFARVMRRMREFLIGEHGLDKADQVLPEYEIDSMKDHADALLNPSEETPSSFSSDNHNQGGADVPPEFTQADIDAAEQRGRNAAKSDFSVSEELLQQQLDSERRQRLTTDFTAFVDGSNLTPAQAEGAVDFMLQLSDAEDTQFEFSAGEGDKSQHIKKTPLQWFKDFAAAVPKQVDTTETNAGEAGIDMDDANALAKAAQDFVASEAESGRTVLVSAAMNHVTKGVK